MKLEYQGQPLTICKYVYLCTPFVKAYTPTLEYIVFLSGFLSVVLTADYVPGFFIYDLRF